jgi:hypothetical protein
LNELYQLTGKPVYIKVTDAVVVARYPTSINSYRDGVLPSTISETIPFNPTADGAKEALQFLIKAEIAVRNQLITELRNKIAVIESETKPFKEYWEMEGDK